ncbi:MAG: HPr family phosphocarrier protein [Oscillospiraceae bacterium]|nr:HPr family phosphocarrier protein [Oscillospiraceae bacterium]
MMEKEIKITRQPGLMGNRISTGFLQKAYEFESDVKIEKNNQKYNAKDLLNLLSAGIRTGDEIKIITEGIDEEDAIHALCAFVNQEGN